MTEPLEPHLAAQLNGFAVGPVLAAGDERLKVAHTLQLRGLVSIKPRREGSKFSAQVLLTPAGYAALPQGPWRK